MLKINILVEGPTEQLFVNRVLQPAFPKIIWSAQIIQTTPPINGQPARKGGTASYHTWRTMIRRLLNDSSATAVTTMFDFDIHALPKDLPGRQDLPQGALYKRVAHLEKALADDINHRRFVPYFSVHDFEALIFTDPAQVTKWKPDISPATIAQLQQMRDGYESPEHINGDDPPSRRVTRLIEGYAKPQAGTLITSAIGLPTLRQHCSHFDNWLNILSDLPPT